MDFQRENAVIPLSEHGQSAELTASRGTVVTPQRVDLSPVIDPGCRCLAPSFAPHATPSIHLDVKLRNRNVWPHQLEFVSANGDVLWRATIPRADPNTVNTWQHVEVQPAGRDNLWTVGPAATGGDGTSPPWHAVHARVLRKALTGAPSAEDIPLIRDLFLVGAAPEPQDAFVVYAVRGPVAMEAQAAAAELAVVSDGATALAMEWTDVAAVVGADPLSEVGTAPVVMMDVVPGVNNLVGGMVLVDSGGKSVTLSMPASEVERQSIAASSTPVGSVTVTIQINDTYALETADFAWDAVTSVALWRYGDALADTEAASAAGRVVVTDVRFGIPQRLGHVSNPDDYNVDDLACDPLTGWFDYSNFVRHDPVRYSHCRECCCFFDDPGNPVVKHCYEQGDIISEVTPAPDMAPNDQCAVCNRNNNPQVMSPRNSLLPFDAEPPYFECDDGEMCTWNDRCRDDGACIAELYTTCLREDFWGGDPSKDCEMCDGTGPNSPTHGCTAKPGHYVYVYRRGWTRVCVRVVRAC